MGGQQELHPDFYRWFPTMSGRQDDVVLSDVFLQKDGFFKTMARIKEHKVKNVVVVGGSHSGFSAAWLLMNGPADILHNTHVKPTCQLKHAKRTRVHFPDAQFKSISECKQCCTCKVKAQKCSCVCKCCGFFRYRDWDFDYEELPTWSDGSIKILYRDKIRVFYNKV